MQVFRKFGLAAIPGLIAAMTVSAAAQTAASNDPNRVVMRVNGTDITAAELAFTANEVLPFLSKASGEERSVIIARTLIERHLLAQEAKKQAEIANAEATKRLAEFYQTKALYDSYIVEKVAKSIDIEKLKAQYEKEAANADLPERVRARHILVATEEEANAVLQKMQAGTSFEDLAKQFSLDGSKEFGGDLGYFSAREMVPEFSNAAYALNVGDVSAPVKTEFGWHIIKLEDRKAGAPPSFDQVRQQILQRARADGVQRELLRVAKGANIEILDPELKRLDELAAANRERLLQQRNQQQQDQAPAATTSGKGDRQ